MTEGRKAPGLERHCECKHKTPQVPWRMELYYKSKIVKVILLHSLIDGAFRQIEIALSDLDLVDTEFELDGTESFEELIRLLSESVNFYFPPSQ